MQLILRSVGRKILCGGSGKDKENKGVKVTDNSEEDRGEEIERMKKIERLLLLYLICIPCQCFPAETVCPGL